MSSYKVTVGDGLGEPSVFEGENAIDYVQAAFLAGVAYAGGLVMLAYTEGLLPTVVRLAGPEASINSLVGVTESKTVTVEYTGPSAKSTVPEGYSFLD